MEAAFQDYAEFINGGGTKMPAATWLELCKGAEEKLEFERAFAEYEQLAAAYPAERQALTAQLSAARLCLKRLNRPQDALALYQKAGCLPDSTPRLGTAHSIRNQRSKSCNVLRKRNRRRRIIIISNNKNQARPSRSGLLSLRRPPPESAAYCILVMHRRTSLVSSETMAQP